MSRVSSALFLRSSARDALDLQSERDLVGTVRFGRSPKCWKTIPIFLRRTCLKLLEGVWEMSSLSRSTSPSVGSIRRLNHPPEHATCHSPEPDDYEDLARLNLEVRVVDADGRPGLFSRPRPCSFPQTPHLQGLPGSTAEDSQRTVLYPDDRVLALNLVSFRGLFPSLAFYISCKIQRLHFRRRMRTRFACNRPFSFRLRSV